MQLYFRSGSLVVNGGGSVTGLSAATTGDYAGLLFWQTDRSTVPLNGSASFAGGAWYAPAGQLILNGGSALTVSALVTKDVTVNGGASITVH